MAHTATKAPIGSSLRCPTQPLPRAALPSLPHPGSVPPLRRHRLGECLRGRLGELQNGGQPGLGILPGYCRHFPVGVEEEAEAGATRPAEPLRAVEPKSAQTPERESMAEAYRNHLAAVKILVRKRPNFEMFEFRYDVAVKDPRAAARTVNEFLGGILDEAAMVAVVDAELYRNRAR